jgi:hypothetical protein
MEPAALAGGSWHCAGVLPLGAGFPLPGSEGKVSALRIANRDAGGSAPPCANAERQLPARKDETVGKVLRAFVSGWKTVTEFIGRVVSVILLTVIYIIVGVPTGLVLRLVGKPPMRVKSGGSSTWEPRDKRPPGIEDARQPF